MPIQIGYKFQIKSIKMRPYIGAIQNSFLKDWKENLFSFVNNFIASLIGCKIPQGPTLLGPCRIWIEPKSLRSNNVKNAIPPNKNTKVIKWLTKEIID